MICIHHPLPLLLCCVLAGLRPAAAHSPGLPLNPDIEAMIASVSPDTLFTNLERLVGFHTRHTSSDTVSDLIGIGAARRFIYRQFQSYASDPKTVELQPSYFTFNQTVYNIPEEHRNVLATSPGVHRVVWDGTGNASGCTIMTSE